MSTSRTLEYPENAVDCIENEMHSRLNTSTLNVTTSGASSWRRRVVQLNPARITSLITGSSNTSAIHTTTEGEARMWR